ncbi:MAG: hypothetical protein AAGN66_16305 [Acidobacteriota bacterium]
MRSSRAGRPIRWGLKAASEALLHRSARAAARRDAQERRRYAEDPWAYARDIVGVKLSRIQDEALQIILEHDRVLLPGANNIGKTWFLGLCAVWVLDARAALPGEESDERGARVLLPGPDHETVFQTIYSEMLAHARRAEHRGHLMPGRRSTATVMWKVREHWNVEAFSPPRNPNQKQAHSVAGRHQLEQWAIIAEGQGVPASVWQAIEGTCSTDGNKIVSDSNPTELYGPFYDHTKLRSWVVHHVSALDHDNVVERRLVIPKAVSHKVVERRIVDHCQDRGCYPSEATPEPEHDDFLYALPPEGAPEPRPRKDGVRGHVDGEIRVYRPRGDFAPKVLGRYPKGGETSLFDPAAWDAGVERWKAGGDPALPPDRVGVDASRGARDAICAAPSWGEDGWSLLLRWAELQQSGDLEGLEELRRAHRVRVGRIHTLPMAKPPATARELLHRWPRSHWLVEYAGGGEGVVDHAVDVLAYDDITMLYPSGETPERLPEEPYVGNFRAAMYARAAMLVARGLVDPPDDSDLREEIMATELEFKRVMKLEGEKRLVGHIVKKEELKKRLGRSPDRADAFAMALCQPAVGSGEVECW